jgi:hypothetical protein
LKRQQEVMPTTPRRRQLFSISIIIIIIIVSKFMDFLQRSEKRGSRIVLETALLLPSALPLVMMVVPTRRLQFWSVWLALKNT